MRYNFNQCYNIMYQQQLDIHFMQQQLNQVGIFLNELNLVWKLKGVNFCIIYFSWQGHVPWINRQATRYPIRMLKVSLKMDITHLHWTICTNRIHPYACHPFWILFPRCFSRIRQLCSTLLLIINTWGMLLEWLVIQLLKHPRHWIIRYADLRRLFLLLITGISHLTNDCWIII